MLRIATSIGLCGLMLWVFTQFRLRGDTSFYRALQDSGHGMAFFLLTLIVLVLFKPGRNNRYWQLLAIPVSMFLLGMSIELVQHVIGRGYSTPDLLKNGAGILSACAMYLLFSSKANLLGRFALATIVVLPMLWVVSKPALIFAAKETQNSLPVLNDFEPLLSAVKLSSRHSVINVATFKDQWPSNPTKSLQVNYGPGRYPSVLFREPAARWCDFGALTFDTYNTNQEVVRINIRVDDPAIGQRGHSFMTVSRFLDPGENAVSVSFEELQRKAQERGLATFQHITGFQVFLIDNDEPVSLYFDNFRLDKSIEQAVGC